MSESTFSWSEFQNGVGNWALYNFGAGPKVHPILGIIEEMSELDEAVEKNDRDEIIDAIGDIVVYLADACFRWGWDLETLMKTRDSIRCTSAGPMSLTRIMGKLAHCTLKTEQNIRGGAEVKVPVMHDALRHLLCYCAVHAFSQNLNLRGAVAKTWAKVSQRDWTKNPVDADKKVPS